MEVQNPAACVVFSLDKWENSEPRWTDSTFGHIYMCFVDLEKMFDWSCPFGCSMGGASGVWGVWLIAMGRLILIQRAIQELGLYKTDSFPKGCSFHQFSSLFLWTEFLGIAKWQKASTRVVLEFFLCFLQMMRFCWLHKMLVSSSLHQICKLAMVLSQKRVKSPL